jgi:hypothetical protein
MEDHSKDHGFLIPKSFLLQLEEYTQGYLLVVCNEKGELFTHEAYDNPVIKIGLVKYADLHVTAALEHMQNTALQEEEYLALEDDDEDEEDDDEEEENDEEDSEDEEDDDKEKWGNKPYSEDKEDDSGGGSLS